MKRQPWLTLAVFEHQSDAAALQIFLNQQGFEARSYNDRLLQLFLFLCPPRATYRVQVRKDQFKPAANFMEKQPASSLIMARALHCPSCDSLAVEYPQMTRKFFTPTLLLHLGIIFRIVEHEAYCEHCHFVWHLFSQRPARKPKPAAAHKM